MSDKTSSEMGAFFIGVLLTTSFVWGMPDVGTPAEHIKAEEVCKINGGAVKWEVGSFYPLFPYTFYCKDGAVFKTMINGTKNESETNPKGSEEEQ